MAANAYNQYVYGLAMEKLTEMSVSAKLWLADVREQWSRHKFSRHVHSDTNTTNFVESFNALIEQHRDQPVFFLLEGIRRYNMEKFGARFQKAIEMDPKALTPYAKAKLDMNTADSRFCFVIRAGGPEFEVRDANMQYPMNLVTLDCLCGQWQVTGVPCKHAVRAILDSRQNPIDFVHPYYSGKHYKFTYQEHFHPIPDPQQWPTFNFPEIQPPLLKRTLGRPPRNRKRATHEPRKAKRKTTNSCSICKHLGHNARSCKGGPTARQTRAATKAAAVATQRSSGAASSGPAPSVAASTGPGSSAAAATRKRSRAHTSTAAASTATSPDAAHTTPSQHTVTSSGNIQRRVKRKGASSATPAHTTPTQSSAQC